MKRALAILWYVLTLRCEEADRIRCCDGVAPVTWWQRWAERFHRFSCGSCRRARRELLAMNATIRSLVHVERGEKDESQAEPGLPDGARDRIRTALRSAQPKSTK